MSTEPAALENPALQQPPQLNGLQKRLLRLFSEIHFGSLRLRFDGAGEQHLYGTQAGPEADIHIHRPFALLRSVALGGDLGFGESFMRGDWSSADTGALLHLLSANLQYLGKARRRTLPIRWLACLRHAINRNSRQGSRRNISAHYDLGNGFYARWLDLSMSYSAAVFDRSKDLQTAQERKYELMFNLIDPQQGEHILEIGCGWGGFAEYAGKWGVRVTGITLSREQYEFARSRVRRAGLQDLVDIRLCDYRDLDETFDHVVSIEMFEAVGQRYWQQYFDMVARCLRPGGRAAFQIITICEEMFEHYAREAGGFIQKYIFPGGMLPTEEHLNRHACAAGLIPEALDHYGLHYAETLAQWKRAFTADTAWLASNGYDQVFRRMWEYYLAFCEGGFRDRRIDLVQFAVTREV